MSRNNSKIKPFVIQCIIMKLSEKESMQYLYDKGFKISVESFYRYKRNIKNSTFGRLALIAKSQFVGQHIERIDQLEFINQEMWSLYRKEKDPTKAAQILMQIAELQDYISPYYEASKWIMEDNIRKENEQKQKKKRTISTT